MSCENVELRTLLGIIEKRMLSRLPAMQNMVKMEKAMPSTAASSFNTHSTDRSETWKVNGCFTLLRRITQFKSVNSEIVLLSIVSLERLSPKGSYHLVGIRHEWHTCSETSYRITDVECIVRAKNTPVNLTGDGEWPGVRNSVEEFCRWNCNNVVDSVFNS